jgi:DNA-binding LacI/PurR family transcriptional regulator
MPTQSRQQITIQDVALAVGAAKSTVSAAFTGKGRVSPERRAEILNTARELGFEPNPHAQRLSNGRSANMVGLFSLTLDYMAWQTMSHLHHELADRGYEAPLYTYGYSLEDWPDYRSLLSSLIRQQPEGIICNTFKLPPEAADIFCQYLQKGGTVVSFYSPLNVPCDQIIFDREMDIRLAIRHLLEAGHHDIGLGGLVTHELFQFRVEGFRRELEVHGISLTPSWLIDAGSGEKSNIVTDEARGAVLAEQFLKLKKRPTALCIVNDTVAATFVHQLLAKGYKVPQDVSVIAIDGMPITLYSVVKITTMAQPREEMALQAVQFLLERLTGAYKGEPRKIVYTGKVIARDSVRNMRG